MIDLEKEIIDNGYKIGLEDGIKASNERVKEEGFKDGVTVNINLIYKERIRNRIFNWKYKYN